MKFDYVKAPLKKALETILNDRKKFGQVFLYSKTGLTVQNLESAAGNHLFDDRYDDLNITKNEGHAIREYFQTDGYSYVADLHYAFPDLLEPESNQYLEIVNRELKMNHRPILDAYGQLSNDEQDN